MRSLNRRVITVGCVLLGGALAFFFYMLGITPRSSDPATLMQTVGMVSGGVGGLSLVMIVVGLIGRKSR